MEIKRPPSTVQPRIQPKSEVQIDNFKIPKFELIRELKQQRPHTRGYFQEFTSGFQYFVLHLLISSQSF